MNWTTIYITGKNDFHDEVLKSLEHSKLNVMPGSTGSEQNICLLWIDETLDVKSVKKAIGSKLVFKYRLHFYRDLNEIQKKDNSIDEFTADETSMIREMNLWDSKRKYKHSA